MALRFLAVLSDCVYLMRTMRYTSLLVVDDDREIVDLYSEILKEQGYEVRTATSAEQARSVIATQHFDLLLLDERMPQMSGTEFLVECRCRYPGIGAIFITAYADFNSATRAFRSGAFDVLQKPVQKEDLLGAVERALLRTETDTALEFYSCFISYSSKDNEFAKRLYADLRAWGVRCWFDHEDLKIGDKFRQRIDEAIRLYDKLLLVLSETSVNSTWVEKEVLTAFEKENRQKGKPVLFPIRLDTAAMNAQQEWAGDIRRTRHIGDFSQWRDGDSYTKAFERLLRDLRDTESASAF